MKDLAIVVSSCGKYTDLWEPFFYYFHKYSNIPAKVYLLSDKFLKPWPIELLYINKIQLSSGDINIWTKVTREAIEQIPENNILFLLEDIWLNEDMTLLFKILYKYFQDFNMNSLKILYKNNKHIHTTELGNSDTFYIFGESIKELTSYSWYQTSFSPTLYRKQALLHALSHADETPWDCELKSSKRRSVPASFTYLKPGWYTNAMIRGNLTPAAEVLMEEAKFNKPIWTY